MKKLLLPALLAIASTFTHPASAATVTLSGTVTYLSVLGVNASQAVAEVVIFTLSNPPPMTGCPGGTNFFSFSAKSVTDANTRRNLLSSLLTAKTAGVTVTVSYDDAGAYCDIGPGYAAPYSIAMH